MTDAIAALEEWKHGHKARWVSIGIDDSYGATCWEVILGNASVQPDLGWYKLDQPRGAVVCGRECSFWLPSPRDVPPNVVYCETEEETFPGLAVVILATLELAKKLNL